MTTTLYRLARPGGEYNALYAMLRRSGLGHVSLGWPTVVAEENGKRVGFLSTIPSDEAVIAGPLVIESATRRPWLFLRLVESYENVLRLAGVTRYMFTVDEAAQGSGYAAQIERVCGAPRRDGTLLTFERSLA